MQVTNKHVRWHLNPDLSPLFVTYIEPLCDWRGLKVGAGLGSHIDPNIA